MYYTIEGADVKERRVFSRYQEACMAALELARRTSHEVIVVRQATASGFGRQIMCVYNCKYEVSVAPPPIHIEDEERASKRRYRRKGTNKGAGCSK